jgi:hypothetical protein
LSEPAPLPIKRLPKQTLHHVWAPKIGRIVLLAGNDQLRLWTMLEAHPGVSKYCERPAWPDDETGGGVVDFWAQKDGHQLRLVLSDSMSDSISEPSTGDQTRTMPSEARGIDTVSSIALDEHRIWIQNWLSLLPYIGPASTLGLDSLAAAVVAAVTGEISIGELEDRFAQFGELAVRTSIVLGLHRGHIASEDLLNKTWDASTRLRRVTGRGSHATW